jgi:pimeloyl-ACP methyl ester carboxylesterase
MKYALLLLLLVGGAARSAPATDCVILLHGLARTSRSMAQLASAFTARGYRVANVDYPSREHRIEALAEIALSEGLRVCQAATHGQIHFVTHSLGGIILRYYLAQHRIPNLGRVVMLAPPNRGSEVVDSFGQLPGFELLNGPAGAQLGTDADSIPLRLGPVDYPVGVIAGTRSINPLLSTALPDPDDGKVSVARAKVEGMTDFIELPISHPFIMQRAAAIAQAVAFIETGAFVRAAP